MDHLAAEKSICDSLDGRSEWDWLFSPGRMVMLSATALYDIPSGQSVHLEYTSVQGPGAGFVQFLPDPDVHSAFGGAEPGL